MAKKTADIVPPRRMMHYDYPKPVLPFKKRCIVALYGIGLPFVLISYLISPLIWMVTGRGWFYWVERYFDKMHSLEDGL